MAVYSKKVEYLYHEVNKMVELLATNRDPNHVGQGEEESRGPRGPRRGNDFPQ